ncbi:NUDIX domain-containing protein [Ponticoccus sp. SC2-23]|uniref:NUDIX hydrolase n=1 Tax=Alexandriicola marinus TaxID=2081710 RepID=UPI000FD86D07|nr:NUDIX domain-containing protein [Alexandriicola marinus]MBM1219301.1 NUDIX domain-containing protein [Ponticoccus sp. SC6-9]MBM1223627.1 NUDIX domain-containing protein [Ponticoccus sp. SC6-15]MBM1229114.1 NUDIX domain-containing protein [Ponticoccus sp. SC6-38]MBM1232593.1 NUDIX domain-containing protein [Ponticoccus sp. SC6-45]MBM1237457.1 NUDIX domain-containing protein [Ponticoccus sp. SC6-49]MBM1241604.1 NUDIX domain-containing protein [Ponticoccus sp. SC2-64]MBM1246117.1 NUDIX domai
MQETALVAPIVSVIVMRHGAGGPEVLLMRRVNRPRGAWCQVAGKVKPGETAWRAALRELHEETGLVPDRFFSGDTVEHFYEARLDRVIIGPVFVAMVPSDAQPRIDAEHDAAEWLGLAEAIARVSFTGQRRVLRDIEETFVTNTPHPDLEIPLQEPAP